MHQDRFIPPSEPPRLERMLLSDQVAGTLREYVVAGRIEPGATLTERHVGKLLGVSRSPVREALKQLQREGLIVATDSRRQVVALDEQDYFQLLQARQALETAAVDLATRNANQENETELLQKLKEFKEACTAEDDETSFRLDAELHRLIWKQAGNPYLVRFLDITSGPLFMLRPYQFASDEQAFGRVLAEHVDLVTAIVSGDREAAATSIRQHFAASHREAIQALSDATKAQGLADSCLASSVSHWPTSEMPNSKKG